jgi:hypothetical protein
MSPTADWTDRLTQDDELTDAVAYTAQTVAGDLPGFTGLLRCKFSSQPQIVGSLPTWDVLVETWHYTAAAKLRVVEYGGELTAELVERYTHAVGDLLDTGDDYTTNLEAAVTIAEAKSRRRSEPVVVYQLGSTEPVVIAIDGVLYDRRAE